MKTILLNLSFILLFALPLFAQQPLPVPKIVSGGVVNGKAISLPKPEYPAAAIVAKIGGSVNVQVTIDEQGNVISAVAVTGHQLLRKVSEDAAAKAKFNPTKLSGQLVKVKGVVIYNFVLPPSTELKEPYWALAMFVSFIELADSKLIKELGNPQEFYEIIDEMPTEFPQEFLLQKDLFLKLKTPSEEEKSATAKELRLSLENNLQGHRAWQFELGKSLGIVVVEMVKFKLNEQGKNYSLDEDKLKISLQKIKELSAAPPTEISKDFVEKFKEVGAFADETDLTSKIPVLFQTIDLIFSLLDA
jgi:TonB family protein